MTAGTVTEQPQMSRASQPYKNQHSSRTTTYTTLGGRVTCTQCNALSKRTRERCKAPAVRGKTKCRFHGGAKGSGRPIVHGRETREKRAERSAKLAELRELEELGFKVGLFAERTPRTRGRKPDSDSR